MEKDKPEHAGKPESPGKSEQAPGHNKPEPKAAEAEEAPELVTVTSNDVGEQTLTHADGAVEPGDAEDE